MNSLKIEGYKFLDEYQTYTMGQQLIRQSRRIPGYDRLYCSLKKISEGENLN